MATAREGGVHVTSDPTFGRLTNPDAWRTVLPSPLYQGLSGWVAGQAFDLTHRRWLTGGESGAYVAAVRLQPQSGILRGAILKLLPPDLAAHESRGVGLAEQHTPPDFYDRHLVPTTSTSPLTVTGWWVHLQEVAQVDLSKMLPLAALIDDAAFAEYCEVIVSSIVNQWNPGRDSSPESVTPADYLSADLHHKLEGLRAFCAATGMELLHPATEVHVPGRPDPLPNPLALLQRTIGNSEKVYMFRGNGHGDLHAHNIFLPVDQAVRAHDFRLVDLGRFSSETPVSRDPMKLLLSVAATWLPSLAPDSAVRSSLAELVVAPHAHKPSPPTAGFLDVARQVHEAAACWGTMRRLVEEWAQQNLLVLAASALRTVGQANLALPDRWWHFEVAALAIRQLLEQGESAPVHPATPPTARRPQSATTEYLANAGQAAAADGLQLYAGIVKVQVCRTLGDTWRELADVLQVRPHEQTRFQPGNEARDIWEWLEIRGRLGELRGALVTLDRPDLVRLLDGDG